MKFRIDYHRVIAQANSIAGDASQLAVQIKQLEKLEQDCKAAWKGEAADAFLAKLSTLRGEMSRTRSQMDTLASTIKYCADRIQREDEENARKAAKLSSGN